MDRSATAPNPIGPGRPTDGESSVGGVTNNQVTNNQKDRQALLVCEKRRADLAQTVRLCNKAVAEHLQTLRELNQASQAGR